VSIRTRFAPSPTGYLHIGGVRTALFNWLLTRAMGGQYILRIDDTDQDRNVQAALQPILDGFRWLGLNWDEGPEVGGPHEPYFQSQRGDRHRAAAKELLDRGFAYRDYSTTEELAELRAESEKKGERFFYDRRFMAETDQQAARFESEGRKATIRLKMPRDGECVINDLVRGEVRVPWSNEQDHVIQRSDGSCIYHLASAVDDHDLEITHVIRSEEHLPNTPRQIFIFESLGYALPAFAHLPYVAEPGGTAKLSKRKLSKYIKIKEFADLLHHGQSIAKRCGISASDETFNPVIVDFYRDIGFDAEAILNYLVLLGWSLDGKTEKLTIEEMVRHFSLERVNKSPASFDPQKLVSFQSDYFASLPLEKRIERARPFAEKVGWMRTSGAESQLAKVIELAADRMKMAGDILDFDYCFVDDYAVDEKAMSQQIEKAEGIKPLLTNLVTAIEASGFDSSAKAEQVVQDFCETSGIKLKQIIHALRVCVTGRSGGFGMFDTLAVVGQQKVVDRIKRVL
jgi:glutamyl/glutaminyl-tRNA synthetase